MTKKSPLFWFILRLGFALIPLLARAETDPKFYAVMTTADVQQSPASITLKWNADPNASGYSVARREGNSWQLQVTLPATALIWIDANVSAGRSYEYRITKSTTAGYQGTSFLLAGINSP